MPSWKTLTRIFVVQFLLLEKWKASNIAARTCHTAHESMLPLLYMLSALCLRRDCGDLCISLSPVFFLVFCLPFPFALTFSLSPVVCENREEPWSWFQYLWGHQWPGEPLQTLRYGTTRPSLPANRSLPGFTSELPWKQLLVTAVFRLSVCVSVCLQGSSWLS